MKATLTFTLPDERDEYADAIKGDHYHRLLDEIIDAFRAKDKYEEKQETTWAEARELLHQTIKDSGIGFEA